MGFWIPLVAAGISAVGGAIKGNADAKASAQDRENRLIAAHRATGDNVVKQFNQLSPIYDNITSGLDRDFALGSSAIRQSTAGEFRRQGLAGTGLGSAVANAAISGMDFQREGARAALHNQRVGLSADLALGQASAIAGTPVTRAGNAATGAVTGFGSGLIAGDSFEQHRQAKQQQTGTTRSPADRNGPAFDIN